MAKRVFSGIGLLLTVVALQFDAQWSPVRGQPFEGTELRRISPEDRQFIQPRWSPDGRWIAVTGRRYTGIYLLDPERGTVRELTSDEGVGFQMAWSPDSRAIAGRVARRAGYRRYHAIKVYEIATGEGALVSPERTIMPATPVWSPTGAAVLLQTPDRFEQFAVPFVPELARKRGMRDWLAVHDGKACRIVEPDGALVREFMPAAGGTVLSAALSPAGGKVAFEVAGEGVTVVEVETEFKTVHTDAERPVWSPDGEVLLFVRTADDGHRMESADLYMSEAGSGEAILVARTPELLELNVTWAPDGRRIAVDDAAAGAIYVRMADFVRPAGGGR